MADPAGMRTRIVNMPSAFGLPSRMAIFDPGGSVDGPSIHTIASGVSPMGGSGLGGVWAFSTEAARRAAMRIVRMCEILACHSEQRHTRGVAARKLRDGTLAS